MAERILMNEFRELSKPNANPWLNIQLGKDDDLFLWDVALIVLNPTSVYYGGYFKAELKFPKNYPYSPPEFRFIRPLWHPNIYKDGKLCISILHPPGEDEMSGELASERWSPAQRVESVLISIISLLDDAEVSSAANVDAGVMLRTQPEEYKKKVMENVEESKRDIPEDFVMPTNAEIKPPPKDDDGEDFWYDSAPESFDGEASYDEDMGSDEDLEVEDESDEEEAEDAEEEEMDTETKTPQKTKHVLLDAEDSSRTATPRPRT